MNKTMKFWSNFNIAIFPILIALLSVAVVSDNLHLFENKDAVMYTYLDNTSNGKVGYGFYVQYDNEISFAGLEPGDIILGGYPDCAYGRFSHAGIYMGNGQVIEGIVDYGIYIRSIDHFRDYTQVCLLQVEAEPEVKKRAVEYAQNFTGSLFYPLAFKPGDRVWNCSKIMWKAYAEQGIDLDPGRDLWISPDTFYYSPYVNIIREKGR